METHDLTHILGIVINLVSGDRTINQESNEVRDFKVATSTLVARLDATASRDDGQEAALKAIRDHR